MTSASGSPPISVVAASFPAGGAVMVRSRASLAFLRGKVGAPLGTMMVEMRKVLIDVDVLESLKSSSGATM